MRERKGDKVRGRCEKVKCLKEKENVREKESDLQEWEREGKK